MNRVIPIFNRHLLVLVTSLTVILAVSGSQTAYALTNVHAYNALTTAQLRNLSGASATAPMAHANADNSKQQLVTYTAWAKNHPYSQEATVSFQRGAPGTTVLP